MVIDHPQVTVSFSDEYVQVAASAAAAAVESPLSTRFLSIFHLRHRRRRLLALAAKRRPPEPLPSMPTPSKRNSSLAKRHTSHVTRHTSLVTRHSSHVTRHIPVLKMSFYSDHQVGPNLRYDHEKRIAFRENVE